MPKGHWKCMGNITPRKVVFLTVNTFAVYITDKHTSRCLVDAS
jgi:hypothetical protein